MGKLLCLIFIILLASCGSDSDNKDNSSPDQEEQDLELETLINRSDVIWGFDFLPDNKVIFTERSGRIMILDPESRDVIQAANLSEVASGGEVGLLDLELHPSFSSNNLVYFCFTEARGNGRGQSLGRATLHENKLGLVQVMFRSNATNNSNIHFGCRIEFENSNQLLLSIGDQNDSEEAQNSSSHLGKILRMNDDGSNVQIFSSGHRNVQGIARRPGTNQIFSSEHGPRGGDELNILRAGENFGWPLVTQGEPAGPLGESAPGFIDPIISWTPAIAPSGITFHQGQLYIATLRGRHIRRLTLEGNSVTNEEVLFESENARFRNVQEGPDGFLYFSTDDGRLGRMVSN